MEDAPSGSRRRPRPMLSCVVCRRKKLKCDRQLPCGECKKTGNVSACTFNNSSEHAYKNADDSLLQSTDKQSMKRQRSSLPSESEPRTDNTLRVIEDLQSRVEILERQLRPCSQQQRDNSLSPKLHQPDLNQKLASSRSILRDNSYRASLISPFEDVQNFISIFRDDPVLKPYVNEVRNIRKSLESDSIASMISMIPPKEHCDALVEFYFEKSEKAMRILHTPSFQQSYERYWQVKRDDPSLPFGFIPQLLAVIANASKSKEVCSPELSSQVCWNSCCKIVEVWLSGLKRRERYLLSTMQARAILVMTQYNIFVPNDKTWNATGSLVRWAVSALLHRDPSLFRDISTFEAELRRRLWATILEMDVQASMISGKPTAVRYGDYDTAVPSALNDSNLFEDMTELPEPKLLTEWNDSTLQVTLANCLPQRLQTAAFVNTLNRNSDEEDIRKHGEAIARLLARIPTVARVETCYEGPAESRTYSPARILGRIWLDLHIRRSLFYLYLRVSLNTLDPTKLPQARRACRDSALVILSYRDIIESHIMNPTEIQDWGLILETEFRYDTVLAALSICREIKMMSHSDPSDSTLQHLRNTSESAFETQFSANDRHDNILWTRPRLVRVVENALSRFIQILDEPGGFLKDVLRVSITLQSVRPSASQEKKMDLMREGVISVAKELIQRVKARNPGLVDSYNRNPGESLSNCADTNCLSPTENANNLDNLESLMLDFGAAAHFDIDEFDFGLSSDWNLY